jgi:hypothetical protein
MLKARSHLEALSRTECGDERNETGWLVYTVLSRPTHWPSLESKDDKCGQEVARSLEATTMLEQDSYTLRTCYWTAPAIVQH